MLKFVHLRSVKKSSSPREGAGSPSSQSQDCRTEAQYTQPLEPILIPKLRIYFADFPYLHCSIN